MSDSGNAWSSNWARRLCVLGLLAAGSASGCGGGSDDEARKLAATTVVATAVPLPNLVYSQAEIERTPPGSPRRAFMRYRQALQIQAWSLASRSVDPGLARYIGVSRLLLAFQAKAPEFRSVRPRIVDVKQDGDQAIVTYSSQRDGTGPEFRSIEWKREHGDWRIVYDSLLDDALAAYVQGATQTRDDPLARKPGRKALRASAAARRIQAQYQQRLDAAATAPESAVATAPGPEGTQLP